MANRAGLSMPCSRADCQRIDSLLTSARAALVRESMQLAVSNAEISMLKEEIAKLRRDAERYRFLRSRPVNSIQIGGIFIGRVPENLILTEEDADFAIDSLLQQEQKT